MPAAKTASTSIAVSRARQLMRRETERSKRRRTRGAQDDRDRVEEAREAAARMVHAVEEVREDVGHEDVGKAERERRGEHEPVAARELRERQHAHAGDLKVGRCGSACLLSRAEFEWSELTYCDTGKEECRDTSED